MPRFHLFQGYGVELEYMIVNRDTLTINPVADELLKHELGLYGSDFENGIVTWSNELVLHVIEIKSSKPEHDFQILEDQFIENIKRINIILARWNSMLMPTAAHPWMNPLKEAKLWPHDNNEVYEVYNRIFDCKGHGWSNLQSTHLNLPFYDDDEFAKLHAAIRLVLPILPALCASSPIIDAKFTGLLDTRLLYYKENQKKIPSITGKVIPEAVFSGNLYRQTIYDKIKADIREFDTDEILDPVWVNSRGAISRFDRGSIEIRLMDVQECPAADLAILSLVIETIKSLVDERFISHEAQKMWPPEPLTDILDEGIKTAERAVISNHQYLAVFGMKAKSSTVGELWQHIHQQLRNEGDLPKREESLKIILNKGSLSTRIINALSGNFSQQSLTTVYTELSGCLSKNKLFF